MGTITTRIAGVTFKNPDGVDRQKILASIACGERLWIKDEANAQYPEAIGVYDKRCRQLGHLPKDFAVGLRMRLTNAADIEACEVMVESVGSCDGKPLGCIIIVDHDRISGENGFDDYRKKVIEYDNTIKKHDAELMALGYSKAPVGKARHPLRAILIALLIVSVICVISVQYRIAMNVANIKAKETELLGITMLEERIIHALSLGAYDSFELRRGTDGVSAGLTLKSDIYADVETVHRASIIYADKIATEDADGIISGMSISTITLSEPYSVYLVKVADIHGQPIDIQIKRTDTN